MNDYEYCQYQQNKRAVRQASDEIYYQSTPWLAILIEAQTSGLLNVVIKEGKIIVYNYTPEAERQMKIAEENLALIRERTLKHFGLDKHFQDIKKGTAKYRKRQQKKREKK